MVTSQTDADACNKGTSLRNIVGPPLRYQFYGTEGSVAFPQWPLQWASHESLFHPDQSGAFRPTIAYL